MTVSEFYHSIQADYAAAKGRLMNDALILRFLRKFATEYKIDALVNAVNAQDGKGIFEACHSLKGVAGNLALTRLYDLASDLTEKTRGLDAGGRIACESECKLIVDEFKKTIDLIEQITA